MRGTLLAQLSHPHDPMPSQLLPVSRQCSTLPPETNVAQDTRDHPAPAGRAVKNNTDTNKGGLWNSRSKQKCNLWHTDHTWAHGLPSSSSCCSSSGSPAGPDVALGLRHTPGPGSRCFFRCITQPLESSDFIATALHLLLLEGTFLFRSDKSSINVRHSPLSPRQRPRNIATQQVLVSFVWSIVEWHGKTKNSYEQTTLT